LILGNRKKSHGTSQDCRVVRIKLRHLILNYKIFKLFKN